MCLAIPAQIVELVDPWGASPRSRSPVSAGTSRWPSVPRPTSTTGCSIHVGFALSRIDEHEARETLAVLERMGEAYEQEVRELKASAEP